MTSSEGADRLVPAGLVALSAIPTIAGIARVLQLAAGTASAPGSAPLLAAPVPLMLHILGSAIFCLLGALQFHPGLRRRYPDWHRGAGRLLVPCGLVVALAGVWISQFHAAGPEPAAGVDGPLVCAIRLVASSAMALSLCLGFAAIRRRDIPHHRAWMLRGYALGLGAGTQALTYLPWHMLPDLQGEVARTLAMAAGWVVNLAVAEWCISLGRPRAVAPNADTTRPAR